MRVRKIKHAKRKRQIENLILKILIVIAVVLILGTIGGLAIYGYLVWKFM